MPTVPATYNTKMYRGADFVFEFRLNENAAPITFDPDTQEVLFRASEGETDDDLFLYGTDAVSPKLTYDEGTSVFTLRIPGATTLLVPFDLLVYDVDLVEGTVVDRWIRGKIDVLEQA